MKKRKKKKLRDKFTDALGEEITARNLNDKIREQGAGSREQTLKVEDKISNSVEVDATKKPPAVETVAENISSDTVEVEVKTAVEIVEVKTDSEFDKRVFAEADNTFHDEQPRRVRRKLTPKESANARAAYRAKMIRDTVADEKENYFKDKKNIDKDADLYRKLSRAETAGVALSALMLVYAFSTLDKPLFFMALSLLSNLLRPIIGGLFGKHNRAVQNALHAFSIVLFFGALLFIFI